MLHSHRTFCVTEVASAEELARALTGSLWAPCAGFRWEGLVVLNDAPCTLSPQDYAVFCRGHEVATLPVDELTTEALTRQLRALSTLWAPTRALPVQTEPVDSHTCCYCL